MKAIVYRDFGSADVLRLEEVPPPVPRDNEVLIRVRAAGLNPLDWRLMHGGPLPFRLVMGIHKLKRPGVDVAGEIQAVGTTVTRFRIGDQVFGTGRGSLAELCCAPETTLAPKPPALSFEQAASIPIAALTALQALRDKARVQAGRKVLINGAAGGVGIFAVQIAKWLGAEVTGVCSTRNVDLVRSLGADRVIDYTQQDFTRTGQRFDVILDCIGNHSFAACRRALTPAGIHVGIAPPKGGMIRLTMGLLRALMLSVFVKEKFAFFMAKAKQQDLGTLSELTAAGKLRPVLDRCFPLSEAPDAFRYLEEGHARGKVVIVVA